MLRNAGTSPIDAPSCSCSELQYVVFKRLSIFRPESWVKQHSSIVGNGGLSRSASEQNKCDSMIHAQVLNIFQICDTTIDHVNTRIKFLPCSNQTLFRLIKRLTCDCEVENINRTRRQLSRRYVGRGEILALLVNRQYLNCYCDLDCSAELEVTFSSQNMGNSQ